MNWNWLSDVRPFSLSQPASSHQNSPVDRDATGASSEGCREAYGAVVVVRGVIAALDSVSEVLPDELVDRSVVGSEVGVVLTVEVVVSGDTEELVVEELGSTPASTTDEDGGAVGPSVDEQLQRNRRQTESTPVNLPAHLNTSPARGQHP